MGKVMPVFKAICFVVAVCCALWLATSVTSFAEEEMKNDESIRELGKRMDTAKKAFAKLSSYRALVILKERHGKKTNLEKVHCTYSSNPQRLLFDWRDSKLYKGLRASYDEKRDGPDHFMALETGMKGLVGAKRWAFDSKIVKTMYPHQLKINQYSLGFLIDHTMGINKNAVKKKKVAVHPKGLRKNDGSGRRLLIYEVDLSDNPADGLLYGRCLIGFDEKTKLPLFVETYDFKGSFYASYDFIEIKVNVPVDEGVFELKK